MSKDTQNVTISKEDVSEMASTAVSLVNYMEEVSQALDTLLGNAMIALSDAGVPAQLMACKEVVDTASSVATGLSLQLEDLEEG